MVSALSLQATHICDQADFKTSPSAELNPQRQKAERQWPEVMSWEGRELSKEDGVSDLQYEEISGDVRW